MTVPARQAAGELGQDTATGDQVLAIVRDRLHIDVDGFDIDLFETGLIDSLAFVDLLMALEQELGVSASVEDLDLDNFRTIDQIARFVDERRRAG